MAKNSAESSKALPSAHRTISKTKTAVKKTSPQASLKPAVKKIAAKAKAEGKPSEKKTASKKKVVKKTTKKETVNNKAMPKCE